MTLQNRVDPFGRIIAVPVKGDLMGNRGILHDENKRILRTHAHQNWVNCSLSWKGISQTPMKVGRYTQLFFRDEATACAAGHRPCATCRRERYNAFVAAWQKAHGGPDEGRSLPHTIDRALHKARINRREKVTFDAPLADLPDGTICADGETPVLIWQGRQYRWSFEGYTPHETPLTGTVRVLTPEPLIEVFRQGYRPEVHASIE